MRFTKFLAATMAAMTITSCAQQELVEGVTIEPGDAHIVLDLGRSSTTYASETTENEIHDGTAKLFGSDGKLITWKSGGTIGQDGKLEGTVSADVLNALTDKNVKLLVEVNGNDKGATPGIGATDYDKEKASTTGFDIYGNQSLATGILSTGEFPLTLRGGTVTSPNTKLKRTVSRIYVKKGAGVTESIVGYGVEITGLNSEVGVYDYVGKGEANKTISYTVTETPETGSYNSNEVVGYVYPSEGASINVSYGAAGVTLTTDFAANKNYAIVVTPVKSSDDSVIDITFTIESWDADEELEMEMQSTLAVRDPKIAGVTITDNEVILPANGLGTTSDFVTWTNFLGTSRLTLVGITEKGAPATRAAIDEFSNETHDQALRWDVDGADLLIAAMPNVTGKDVTYTFEAKAVADGVESTTEFTITVPAVVLPNYPEGFTTMFSGIEWMTINTQNSGVGQDDIAVYDAVDAMEGSTIVDKLKAYSAASESNHNLISGEYSKFVSGATLVRKRPTCPAGFIVPSSQMLRSGLLGVNSAWGKATEDVVTVAEFDRFEPSTSSFGSPHEYFAHDAGYGGGSIPNKKGYVIIKNTAGEELFIPWRGNLAKTSQDMFHISGLISRTPNGATSFRRLVYGHSSTTAGTGFTISDTAVSTTTATTSSLVRCVKISPSTYWDVQI